MDLNGIRINLLKLLDGTAGRILCTLLGLIPLNRGKSTSANGRILIIRPGGVGDAVLLVPALKVLRRARPDSVIDILAEKRNSGFYDTTDFIDNIYRYDDLKSLDIVKVLKNSYDLVIDTEQWHRLSAVTGFFTGAPERIGFGTNSRRKLFTSAVGYDQKDYEVQSFLNLVNVCLKGNHKFDHGVPFIKSQDKSAGETGKEFEKYAERFKRVVGIFPGATVKERRWGIVNFTLLAERLISDGIGVILFGGPGDVQASSLFNRIFFNGDFLDLTGKTTLNETVSAITKLDLFISADTGLMHISYASGTRTLALFGAGNEDKWGPKGNENIVINKNLFCSPCTEFGYTPKCPYDVRCLKLITVDEVYEKARKLLN